MAFTRATSFALGVALSSKEDIVVVVVAHLGQEVVSVFAFTFPVVSFALSLASYEASDFPDWLVHVLPPH